MDRKLETLLVNTQSDFKTISATLSKVIPKIDVDSVIDSQNTLATPFIPKNTFYYTRVRV